MNEPILGPHTLKPEYHEALEKGMRELLITQAVQARVMLLKESAPAAYIALAALAYEHGNPALLLGIRVAFPYD